MPNSKRPTIQPSNRSNRHKLSRSSRTHTSLASIVQRLPLSQRMNASQAFIVKLTPVWLDWANANLPSAYQHNTFLSSFENGELCISCANASSATQIKHQQTNLLDALHNEGFCDISQLRVRLSKNTSFYEQANISNTNNPLQSISSQTPAYETVSKETIKSLESCQKQVNDEGLAAALARLSSTLVKSLK